MMGDITELILQLLEKHEPLDSLQLAAELKQDHQKIVGAIKSLQSLGEVIRAEQLSTSQWELTVEGQEVVDKGSHEVRVFKAVPETGAIQAEIMKLFPNAKVGFSKAIAAGWIQLDKLREGGPVVVRKVPDVEDVVQDNLKKIASHVSNGVPDGARLELKKRKLVQEVTIKKFNIFRGSEFSTSVSKQEVDLTAEMIATGSWKSKQFKPYNFDARGVVPPSGHLHPLMKVRSEFRQIFLEMGFTEMATNNFIESSFWNFDALFVPQKHPAREAQDTFYMTEPKMASSFPEEYLQRVKKVHQEGGYGSQGYQYEWKREETSKNTLRTHTTAVSARMLHALAQKKPFTPVKYFSIDRVFRNETLDATHLAEFHQIEGVIADYGLTLGDLIGTLYQFFSKLGITKLRFKPAYNPYTEPSMEIFSYHEGLAKWVEVGNSGCFRPEMLLPMGLSEDVRVIAWGLSLERPTMIKYGIDNIRDLVGHRVNLQMVHDNPICRLDKNPESQAVEVPNPNSTEVTKSSSSNVSLSELALHINPAAVSPSILVLLDLLSSWQSLQVTCHAHSTLNTPVSDSLQSALHSLSRMTSPSTRSIIIRWIWSPVQTPKLHISNLSPPLLGQTTIIRFLARLANEPYDRLDPVTSTLIDDWLDRLDNASTNELVSLVDSRLANSDWLASSTLTLADIGVYGALFCHKSRARLPKMVQNWMDRCAKTSVPLRKIGNLKL